MIFEMVKTKLDRVCQFQNGYAFKSSEFATYGNPIIRLKEIKDGTVTRFSDSAFVDCDICKYSKYQINNGDVIFALTGDPVSKKNPLSWTGRVARYHGTETCLLNQRVCKLITDEKLISKDYIYYYFRDFNNFYSLAAKATGSASQANISTKTIGNVEIPLPSLPEQRAIAATLSCLDDKIELNNRMNKTLEEMAQAIFKSWFVDFEPFQDGEFVDSELGRIPKGWRVGTLADLLEVKYGKDHKKLPDGAIPVYGSGGLMRYADKAIFSGESVLIPRKGTLSNLMYVNEAFWTVDTMFYTVMKYASVAKYVYQSLLTKDLASMNAGSAVPSMTTDILNNLPVLIPCPSILDQFDSILTPLYKCIAFNRQHSNKLAQIRDSLLPKLMNGEICIQDFMEV